MNPNVSSIQVFLRRKQSEAAIVDAINKSLGIRVESDSCRDPAVPGYVQIDLHSRGFEQSLLISWLEESGALNKNFAIAKSLAATFGTDVLLEVSDEPDHWLLSQPSGEQEFVYVEDVGDGLDVRTR